MKTKLKLFSLMAVLSLFLVSCGDADIVKPNVDTSISSVIARTHSSLDSLNKALIKTNMVSTFESGSYTVFAPNNEAFKSLIESMGFQSIDEVPVDALTDILKYHVTEGVLDNDAITDGQVIQTLLPGQTLTASVMDGAPTSISSPVTFTAANITYPDWQCSNGRIHVIDAVLLPN